MIIFKNVSHSLLRKGKGGARNLVTLGINCRASEILSQRARVNSAWCPTKKMYRWQVSTGKDV